MTICIRDLEIKVEVGIKGITLVDANVFYLYELIVEYQE